MAPSSCNLGMTINFLSTGATDGVIVWTERMRLNAKLLFSRLVTRGGNRLHSQLPSECDYLQSTRVYGAY